MRKTISTEQLKKVSDHLLYEIQMLNETSKLFDEEDTVRNNCYIESFGIHARVVLDFLMKQNGGSDDVLAIDFFEDPTVWKNQIKEKSEILKSINKRVAKELAHLTYTRLDVEPEQKRWNKAQICGEINDVFNVFFELVPRNKICDDLVKYWAQTYRKTTHA